MRIVVAMSGGVDSSVAAGLLVEAGHEVVGLAMRTHTLPNKSNRACCTPEDMRDARRVADQLGIKFYVLDYEETFYDEVVRPFAAAYRAGRTPNPCVACNDRVKFRALLHEARVLGAEKLATGHYAQVVDGPCGKYLGRGSDPDKDQAYFLYRLDAAQLDEVMFPVGQMDKATVRAHAERMGLPVAQKHESQEICFVGAAGYAATVEAIAPLVAGPNPQQENVFIDLEGRVLGPHLGVHHFTLGQRRGLGISAPVPLYVVHIDGVRGHVTVGPKEALLGPTIDLEGLVWTHGAPELGTQVLVQRRHRGQPEAAVVTGLTTEKLELTLAAPAPRAAPGQAAVLFEGERVLGGGTVADAPRALRVVAGP